MPKGAQVTRDPTRKNARKRSDTQIARDRALVAEYHYKGYNDGEITEILNNRDGVEYTLTRRQVTHDRNYMVKKWQEKATQDTDLWMAEALMQIEAVQNAAWKAWDASLDDHERLEQEEIYDEELDELRLDKIKRAITKGTGDQKWLDIILKCVQEKNRLRGLYEHKVRIDSRHQSEIVVKGYQQFSPAMWDDPTLDVIDGEVVKQIPSGDNGG